ncbi:hypothetical protein LMJF_08_0630 [Leishmania major strain Friedlin]|uniref:Uncharacterized protein n=1 Tax=Leishmania major TaxID=5664 RepID=Q4QIA6_LEIMA|nr:hypothetical protein LMJF_08_0630 [Leishmania major strain Friedlin]CAG9569360.1 hypothetical_protein_-_conserved [Leishmania major strain Friedlin]CAJ02242.1 hypothetical protein LMJF_08_0630 [Leishmania major strain Friedlin]|eukprot:XP_001681092.1 hypothetical protein LMJF_08_0630 [Leishmania major strain Friedlin]
MTDHYFPSPHSLAFRQLFHARNNQSALYCFDMKDVSSVMPEDVAAAFRTAQEEDWGAEVDEVDPSLHYYDDEIRQKVLEFGRTADSICEDAGAGAAVPRAPRIGQHLRPSIEGREELYRVLVTEPMEGTLVDTDSEMCALFEQEQRWRAALPHLSNGQQQQGSHSGKRCNANGGHGADEKDADNAQPVACASATRQQSRDKAVKKGPGAAVANGAGFDESAAHSQSIIGSTMSSASPPPPAKFLYPIPRAIALRLTREEEEEMRAEYCRQHRIPYVAPAFHSVGTATGNRADACAGGFSAQQQHMAPPTPLPVVERRHYHFESDPQYRDGRVHLVEEHGVLYHFAYFAKRQFPTTAAAAAAAAESSRGSQKGVMTGGAAPSGVLTAGKTSIVRGRCLHDVVYCEKPSASPASSSKHAAASSSGFAGSEPEVAPPVRYTWCARCGERVTQRMDYTQLRRLKSTRAHRRTVRRRLPNGDQDSPREKDSVDEVASNTERVDEEGEEEFIINIMPVRVVGMDGLLPSRSRGTPWLRGYEQESEAAEDAYMEQLEQKPPVMRVCRFIEGSVGDKIVNRAALVTLLSYRPMCLQAGLSDALTRPIWSMCVLSNIPYLQMVRETFFRAKAAVAEVDDDDLLLRNWLDVVDRENNFYNFINANLHMTRNFTPPERAVRQREQTDDVASAGTASRRRTTTGGGCGVREGGSVGIDPAGSSSVTSPSLLKTAVYSTVGDNSSPAESHAARSAPLASGAATSPSRRGAALTAAVAACESAETAGQTTDAAAQGVCGKRQHKDGDLKPAEGDGADLRSRHLTRALEDATIGRPEGHDPRDQVEEDEDDEDGADEEGGERGASDGVGVGESDAAAKAAARREKGKKKLQHKDLGLPSLCWSTASPPASSTDQSAADPAAASTSPFTEDTNQVRNDDRGNTVAASVMGGLPAAVGSHYEAHRHRSGRNEDGEDASGEPPATTTTTPRLLPNSASARSATGQGNSGVGDGVRLAVNNFDDDDDPDLGTEEERRRARVSAARISETSGFSLQRPTAPSRVAGEAPSAEKQPHQQRLKLPPRPNFQLFSSRLEPHAPLSLCTLFDYDASADQAAKRTVTQLAAAVAAGVAADHTNGVGSRDEDGVGQATAASAAPEAATTVWPSYVQRDILRENERQQAEPKATRRPSHALYECGMLATTRGRNFLFLLREDCVRALLFYCSAAAAPIFIGAYIEPVDTTSLSYGGAVRLRRPSTVDIPLHGGDEDGGSRTAPARNYDGERVVIGQVEGMEVMAEYFKSKGLITCFSVSDLDKAAPGPSAAHRLRKMILPTTSLSTTYAQRRSSRSSSSSSGGLAGEADSLAAQQARELAQYGHVFTYAADEFCDGDLVVFNFEMRRWEHYEHVQLRRRFAARAATDTADAVATAASAMSVRTDEPTFTGNVAVAADGSWSCASSVVDLSMSARLLCVGLDELLLSWTKWIVDNRFYEDRTDLGWLTLPDGSPIQLGGRYFLWSFRHNHQRYFYGVIPKFAKGRLRRQKMVERNRSKKDAEAPCQQAQPLAGILTSPVGAQRSSDVSVAPSAPSSPELVTVVAATPSSPPRPSGKSPWRTNHTLEAQHEGEPRRRGGDIGTGSLHADPALGDQASSSPPHPGLGVSPPARAGTTQQSPLPREQQSTSAATQAVSTAAASSAHPAAVRQRQRHSSPHLQTQQPIAATSAPLPLPHRMNPLYTDSISYSASDANITLPQQSMPQWANTNATASRVSAAPATAGEQAQQGNFASSLNSAGGFSVHVGSDAARSTLCSPKIATESLTAAAATTTTTKATTAVRRAPFLNPPPQQPLSGTRNRLSAPGSPAMYRSGPPIGFGGGPNYYYQYGGNTFIQDGKQQENEYYPPLPMSTPFHPVTAITKLVPLPHPKTGRGGIPAIFRFWGPIGSPAPRTPVPVPSLPNAGGVAATVFLAAIPISLVPQQMHPLSPRHPATGGSPAASSPLGGGESMGMSLVEVHHHSNGSSLGAGSPTAPAITPAPATAAAGASAVNLTVRVRRRTGGGNTAAIRVGGGASLAPLQLPSQGTSSLGASLTTLATTGPAKGPGTPFKHSPITPSNLPPAPLFAQSAPAQLLVDDSGSQRLSPTSMLPTNLVNEGSKTKGESVLRVDEDTYMQREAFRWNPYASTKWAQNRSNSTGASTSDSRGRLPVEGGSGSG